MAEVRLLRPDDDRAAFRSGDLDLDRFFTRFAGQNRFRHHIGATYVAVEDGRIVGFVTVSPGQVEVAEVPDALRARLPRYPVPVLRLARLAVAEAARGRGLGSLLVVTALELAHELSRTVGCVGVVLDAKSGAVPFYTALGFRPLEVRVGALDTRPEPLPVFLALAGIPTLRGP